MITEAAALVRRRLVALVAATAVTAWFSYGVFHNDEYFQVIELARSKLAPAEVPVLTWEYDARIRPWLQPFVYWVVGRALRVVGIRDLFHLAFAFRLVTGLANVGAVALFLRTTLPWQRTAEARRVHVNVVTLAGFLPYLFVRTSSESGSMAALTAGWALLLEGASPDETRGTSWSVPSLDRDLRIVVVGLLFGLAFELRFQTAFLAVGILTWTFVVARPTVPRLRTALAIGTGLVVALALGAVADRWGYGVWTFPAWSYFRVNVLQGVARAYGTAPPLAYLWLLPANVFLPSVVTLLGLGLLAWLRHPRHPITWATVPFFLAHNLVAHKEERFLFPIAILATGFVTMALAPEQEATAGRIGRIAAHGWMQRDRAGGKLVVGTSLAMMALLALYPLGWQNQVRFTRALHERLGDEVHATALPEIDPHPPAFHPRVYDVQNASADEAVRRLDAGTAGDWLIADRPVLRTGTRLDREATLVWSELPGYADPAMRERLLGWVDAYNRAARPPLRPLRYRSLYRLPAPR